MLVNKKGVMRKIVVPIVILLFTAIAIFGVYYVGTQVRPLDDNSGFAGSESCKECHERFYSLWEPSHHGKAMQLMDSSVIAQLAPLNEPITVGDYSYTVNFTGDSLIYHEYNEDGSLNRKLPVVWALGGKNVFYFLTPWEKGKLQTLPLAWDCNRYEWYDNPRSGIRDFIEPGMQDSSIRWTHSLYTFNTTCHSCHVSQLEKNYNEETGEYHTIWNEAGINCETCHGPSKEHNDVCRAAAKRGEVPEDLKIISTSNFTADQHNSSCSSCHAKMTPLTEKYPPGETFYDHFNLVTLESPDYYPDGRDLGENYTYTTWIQSECVMNTDLHCVSCHTSSGRYRFKGEEANNACMPCHKENVDDIAKHSHHAIEDGLECVSCHMPKTEFARMIRSDHSMRPPMPAATIAFGSPNACNSCHDDKSPEWSNRHVTKWKGSEYQEETLYYGGLVKEARQNNFKRISEMVKMISDNKPNDLFVASIIRLLVSQSYNGFEDELIKASTYPSPLVRSAAAEALGRYTTPKSTYALLIAAEDSLRAVRINAGMSLANMPQQYIPQAKQALVNAALEEYKSSLTTRPDNWSSHYNLGNFQSRLGDFQGALKSFNKASMLEPEVIGPIVNASMVHTQLKDNASAETMLRKALALEPNNPAVNINMGLLMGELGRFDEAKKAYLTALKADDQLVTAAYNLAIISGKEKNMDDAVMYATMAAELNTTEPRYLYTKAFYLNSTGQNNAAIGTLKEVIAKFPVHYDSYNLLESIYIKNGDVGAAIALFEGALKKEAVPEADKNAMRTHIEQLKQMQ